MTRTFATWGFALMSAFAVCSSASDSDCRNHKSCLESCLVFPDGAEEKVNCFEDCYASCEGGASGSIAYDRPSAPANGDLNAAAGLRRNMDKIVDAAVKLVAGQGNPAEKFLEQVSSGGTTGGVNDEL